MAAVLSPLVHRAGTLVVFMDGRTPGVVQTKCKAAEILFDMSISTIDGYLLVRKRNGTEFGVYFGTRVDEAFDAFWECK